MDGGEHKQYALHPVKPCFFNKNNKSAAIAPPIETPVHIMLFYRSFLSSRSDKI